MRRVKVAELVLLGPGQGGLSWGKDEAAEEGLGSAQEPLDPAFCEKRAWPATCQPSFSGPEIPPPPSSPTSFPLESSSGCRVTCWAWQRRGHDPCVLAVSGAASSVFSPQAVGPVTSLPGQEPRPWLVQGQCPWNPHFL